MFEETNKSLGFDLITIQHHVSNHLMKLNGTDFYGKPIIIENKNIPRIILSTFLGLVNDKNV